jgi:hypothetical protein
MIKVINSNNEDLIRRLGSAGGTGSAPKAPAGAAGGGVVDGFLASTIGFIRDLGTSSSVTSKAVDGFGAVLGKMPILGQTMQAAFGEATKYVQASADGYQQQVANGAAFSGGMLDYSKSVAGSLLTNEQFAAQQNRAGQTLNGLSGSNAEAMKTLTEFQNEVRASPMGDKLRALSSDIEVQNMYINSALAGTQNRDLKDAKSKKDAMDALDQMSTSAIANSIATGKSTKSQLEAQQAMQDGEYANSMKLGGDESTQRELEGLGPAVANLGPTLTSAIMDAMDNGGSVTGDKNATTISILGPAGQELINAAMAIKDASREGATQQEKQAAQQQMLQARANVNAQMQDPNFQKNARNEMNGNEMADGLFRALSKERMAELRSDKANIADISRQTGKPATNLDSLQMTQLRAQRTMAQETPTGEKQVGADLMRGQAELNQRGRAEAAAFPFQQMTKFGTGLDDLGKKMSSMGRSDGKVVTGNDTVGSPFTSPTTPTVTQQNTPTARGPRLDGSPGMTELADSLKKDSKPAGWMSVLENFNPKGEMVQLDNKEVVVNEKQWAGIGDAIKGDSKGPDPTKMFGDIQKQISPMLGNMQKQAGPMMDNMQKQAGPMMADLQKQAGPMMADLQKQMGPMMDGFSKQAGNMEGTFKNMKLPIDDKQISSMFGNMKMPAMPDMSGQLANAAKSMMPPTDALASKDINGLTQKISSIAQPPKAPEPARNEYDDEPATPITNTSSESTPSESFNSDILKALNDLNKISAAQLAALEQNGSHAEKLNNSVDGLNGNRFA